jgi:hypothetical protein
MPLITRLDSRSENNSTLAIRDEQGCILAVITCKSSKAELGIVTAHGLYIDKPTHWRSAHQCR